MHPTQPDAVPLYYASLGGFVGLTEHLIASHSRDVNGKGGSHTTHAASVKGDTKVVSLLRSGADSDSRDDLGRVSLHRISQDISGRTARHDEIITRDRSAPRRFWRGCEYH